jgi:hypothetical protein
MTGTQSFAVYLTDEVSTDLGDDPIHAADVDFYDSGIWVLHDGTRDFFPYERVLRVRETGNDEGDDLTGERRDAASGTAGPVDETSLDVE